ncbi:hypothetical protein ACOSP6_08645 [Tenacibaculum sp. MEBiC06402]|uniref:hypothetical protein n=1 Tax=unclassified Tenacibaculum TaxID=2635139 RepID=UPI003B9D956C
MKKSILNLGRALEKGEQKKVKGGNPLSLECQYQCDGTNYELVPGQGSDCYLNYPAIITNHPSCGGSGGSTGTGGGGIRPTGGGIEIWA